MEEEHGCFFQDKKRRADYVLVVKETSPLLTNYISSLEKLGLELEVNQKPEIDKSFLIIHIPQKHLKNYSKIYDIGLEVPIRNRRFKLVRWADTNLDVPAKRRGTFSSKERILIINQLLQRASFGEQPEETGLPRLLKRHVIEEAYPLHDGSAYYATDSLRQNDRRLLYLHWARFRCWYKKVPLDLVYNYFGCEIAFYFAWLEFFNIMLLPAAVLGLSFFIFNFVDVYTSCNITEINEVCEDKSMYICPICPFDKYCQFRKLSSFCYVAKGNYLFDNYLTVAYAVFMSFWATLFLNLWNRKQNTLKLKWGVHYVDNEEAQIRFEYRDELRKRNLTTQSDGLEPFLPKYVRWSRMIATISVCAFMVLLVLMAIIAVIIFKIIVRAEASAVDIQFFKKKAKTVAIVTGSILQVIFIKIFGTMYGKLSIWLTNFENPRTQRDFDKSVLYKRYFLSFVNNYAALFYLAFIKGRFYGIPYRNDILRMLQTDTCRPTNCILALCIQLAFLMLLKKFIGNILTLIILNIKTMSRTGTKGELDLPIFEADYALLPTNRYLLTTEFCEMIIEFGFVTFFVAAFPLAPLCALLNNLLEHRLDAMKLVTKFRRPIPRKMGGIGAWNGVLLGVTYLSTATNAFVIGFTSDFVWRQAYRQWYNADLRGYVNSTLSEYATQDYKLFRDLPPKPEFCYYQDMRHPPDHPEKYELTSNYWVDMVYRLICVLVFEHVILMLNGILSYVIPDIPKTVKEHLHYERYLAKQAKVKNINDTIHVQETKRGIKRAEDWIML